MNQDTIPLFLSFCVEQYKHSERIKGEEALNILQQTGALDYLERNYEVLHTQSPQWILEEITEFVKEHKHEDPLPRR